MNAEMLAISSALKYHLGCGREEQRIVAEHQGQVLEIGGQEDLVAGRRVQFRVNCVQTAPPTLYPKYPASEARMESAAAGEGRKIAAASARGHKRS